MNLSPAMKTKLILILALSAMLVRAETPLEQAVAALKAGDLATAESLLTPLATGAKPDAAAIHQLGIVRLQQKKTKEAVELAEQAVKLDATKADYHSQLGIASSQRMSEVSFMQQAMLSGKTKKAFEQAVALDPKHLGGLIGLARWFSGAPEFAGGSSERAKEFAGRVREIQPFLGEIELGRVAERSEDFAEALARYEVAALLQPGHAGAENACGRMLAQLGRKDEARARFEAALKLDPGFEPAKKGRAGLDAPAN